MDVQTLGAALSLMKKSSMDPEQIETAVDDWLDEHITNPSNPPLDRSLTQDSAAAPADMVGELKSAINSVDSTVKEMNLYDVETEDTEITSQLASGQYYSIGGDIGSVVSTTPTSNVNFNSGIFEVEKDDLFVITGSTNSDSNDRRVYCFTDESYHIIEHSAKGENFTNEQIKAPADGYLFINVRNNATRKIISRVVSGKTLNEKIEEIEDGTVRADVQQSFTESEKEQARTNIGVNINTYVHNDADQNLTSAQKAQAVRNIGAVGQNVLANNMLRIPNLVIDPTFKNLSNTSAFNFEHQDSMSVTDGVLTCVSENSTSQIIDIKITDTEQTDIVYYNAKAIKQSGDYATIACYGKNTTYLTTTAVTISGYVHGGTGKYVRISGPSRSVRTISIYCPIAINVTAMFGAGHEPSFTEFEKMLEKFDRDLFGEWISLQKYDALNEQGHIWAYNLAYRTPLNGYDDIIQMFSENGVSVTGNGNSPVIKTPGMSYQSYFSTGDILYASICMKVADANCNKLVLWNDLNASATSRIMQEIDSPVQDTWYRLSGVIVGGSTSGTERYMVGCAVYEDDETQSGKTLTYKLGMALNLTTIFGKGREPMDATVIDKMLEKFENQWFCGIQDIWNPVYPMLMTGYAKEYNNGAVLGVAEEGRLYAKSVINSNIIDWSKGQFNYGLSSRAVPINHKFDGGIETNGMVSIFPKYGRWEKGAADQTGETGSIFGGHVFEAWNNAGTYRLTMMMAHGGDEREDEACIITYCPGVFNSPLVPFTDEQSENRITPDPADYYGDSSTYMQGRIRIGSDKAGQGTVFRSRSMKCYGSAIFNGSYGSVNHNNSSGEKGTLKYDENYLYICVADNTWRRVALDDTW